MDIKEIITRKLKACNGMAEVPLLRGGKVFRVCLTSKGVFVDNLANDPLLVWKVFIKAIELLEREGGTVTKGDAMNGRLGDEKLPFNSLEGYIAREVYGKEPGEYVFRRITPIVNILIWAGVCENEKGKVRLKEV